MDTLKNITWKQFYALLISDRDIKNNKHNLASHEYYFNRVRNYFFDKEFTNANIRAWKVELLDQNVSPSTYNKIRQMCSSINILFELGIVITVSRMRETQKDFEVLSDEEIIAIANVEIPYPKCKDYLNKRNKAFILLSGLSGGNRLAEALAVPWKDIRETPKKYIIFRDTKNGEKREVFLSQMAWEAILDLPRKRDDTVFCSYRGLPITQDYASTTFSEDIRDRCRVIGIPEERIASTDDKEGISFYTLRHSWATNRINDPNNNLKDLEIAYTMGHKDTRNLQKYVRKSLEISQKTILSASVLKGEVPKEEVLNEVRESIIRLTKYHPDFDPVAIEKMDLSVLLR